tara:strand:+ start:138 stop:302 length:165 start_codon:yes stop_codon:yes gene_type:complete
MGGGSLLPLHVKRLQRFMVKIKSQALFIDFESLTMRAVVLMKSREMPEEKESSF